jgi:hypothetical protein
MNALATHADFTAARNIEAARTEAREVLTDAQIERRAEAAIKRSHAAAAKGAASFQAACGDVNPLTVLGF